MYMHTIFQIHSISNIHILNLRTINKILSLIAYIKLKTYITKINKFLIFNYICKLYNN